MKKRLKHSAVLAVVILAAGLAFLRLGPEPPIVSGPALPRGKVQPQMICAGDSAALIAPDGSLWVWGGKDSGLFYLLPQATRSEVPIRLGTNTDWAQIAGDGTATLALKTDGSLWGWGLNRFGRLGQANTNLHLTVPTRIGTDSDWRQVSVSWSHCAALKKDGSVWAWGFNRMGQVGDGTVNDTCVPVKVGARNDWRTVATGNFVTLALRTGGTLWGWGASLGGSNSLAPRQLGSGTNWAALSAVADGDRIALKSDGTLWHKGPILDLPNGSELEQVGTDHDWTEICAGNFSFLARKKDGSWWGRGVNGMGELGLASNSLYTLQSAGFECDPWAFAHGDWTTLILMKDGRLWSLGERLGAKRPPAARQKIQNFCWPVARRIGVLRALYLSDKDKTPHLLWELPREVRRTGKN